MASTLDVGQSQTGKTTRMVESIEENVGKVTKVVCDPQNSLSDKSLLHIAMAGQVEHVRFVRLSDVKRGFGFLQLRRSTSDNPLVRQQENDNEIMNFARILLNRSTLTPAINRVIWEGLSRGLNLLLHSGSPLFDLPYTLRPGTSKFAEMMRNCDDDVTREQMEEIARLSRSAMRSELGPALRIAEVCQDPAFIACCGSVIFDEQLKKRQTIIFSADGVNRDTARTLLLAAISKTIQFSERHDDPVELYIDEWNNWDLLTPEFGDAIASLQKKNLRFTLASQTLTGNEKVLKKVIENCQIRRYHRLGNIETIRFAASDIGTSILSQDGEEATERDIRRRLAQMPTGAFYEVDHGHVRYCEPPKPKDPYPWPSLAEQKIEELISKIRSLPDYHDTTPPQSESTGEAATPRSSSNAEYTRPRTRSSDTLSQAARRRLRQMQSSAAAPDSSPNGP